MKYFYIFLLGLLMSSCQKPKDWNCTCDYSGINGDSTATYPITNKTQNDANTTCSKFGSALTGG